MCYAPIGTRATIAGTSDAGTFGVSAYAVADGADMEASGVSDAMCTTDRLEFATGAHFAAASTATAAAASDIFKICGR